MAVETFQCNYCVQHTYAQISGTYSEVHDNATSLYMYEDPDAAWAMQQAHVYDDTHWQFAVHRTFLYWDTSSLPVGANITNVILKVFVLQDMQTTERTFQIVIQNGQPTYPHNPSVSGDYLYSHYSANGGEVDRDDVNIGTWNYITLNETGRNWVNIEGETKLALRVSRDIENDAPPDMGDLGLEGIQILHSYESRFAELIITYDLGITVTTQAATEIAYECAMGNGTITSGTNATERGFEVRTSFAGTLNDYIHHSIADFDGTASYNMATGKWEGTLTKTESESGDFAEGAYELVLGYPSVLGNPSHIFNDKLFKCEDYTYRARATIDAVEYYGEWVAFSTLCDSGGDQQVDDDISDGNPTEPIIPIEPEEPPWEPPQEEEEEEIEFPPWDFPDFPPWEYPDYPPSSWVGDFYYRKPYTQKDLDELRKKCIIYNKNSVEYALVLRHNMNVLKEFFNMMTDYMDKEEFNDFTDLIPPQRLKELCLDPLEPTDFRDMINEFIRNTVDNNIAVNRNFKLIQEGLSEYETESDDAYFRDITSSMKTLQQDDPDVERMKRLIDSLNSEVAMNFRDIMHNLKIIRAKLL